MKIIILEANLNNNVFYCISNHFLTTHDLALFRNQTPKFADFKDFIYYSQKKLWVSSNEEPWSINGPTAHITFETVKLSNKRKKMREFNHMREATHFSPLLLTNSQKAEDWGLLPDGWPCFLLFQGKKVQLEHCWQSLGRMKSSVSGNEKKRANVFS